MTFYAIYRFVSPVLMFYKSRHCWIKQVYERNDMQFEALICLYLKKKLRKMQPESLVLMLVWQHRERSHANLKMSTNCWVLIFRK